MAYKGYAMTYEHVIKFIKHLREIVSFEFNPVPIFKKNDYPYRLNLLLDDKYYQTKVSPVINVMSDSITFDAVLNNFSPFNSEVQSLMNNDISIIKEYFSIYDRLAGVTSNPDFIGRIIYDLKEDTFDIRTSFYDYLRYPDHFDPQQLNRSYRTHKEPNELTNDTPTNLCQEILLNTHAQYSGLLHNQFVMGDDGKYRSNSLTTCINIYFSQISKHQNVNYDIRDFDLFSNKEVVNNLIELVKIDLI